MASLGDLTRAGSLPSTGPNSAAEALDPRRVGEGDVEGVAVDRPEFVERHADLVDRAFVLVGEGQVGDGRGRRSRG